MHSVRPLKVREVNKGTIVIQGGKHILHCRKSYCCKVKLSLLRDKELKENKRQFTYLGVCRANIILTYINLEKDIMFKYFLLSKLRCKVVRMLLIILLFCSEIKLAAKIWSMCSFQAGNKKHLVFLCVTLPLMLSISTITWDFDSNQSTLPEPTLLSAPKWMAELDKCQELKVSVFYLHN